MSAPTKKTTVKKAFPQPAPEPQNGPQQMAQVVQMPIDLYAQVIKLLGRTPMPYEDVAPVMQRLVQLQPTQVPLLPPGVQQG